MLERLLQPIKAKLAGRSGFKHTLAYLAFTEQGEPGIKLTCMKSGCGCGGVYSLEELIELVGEIKRERKDAA